jgi:hypothetical protein
MLERKVKLWAVLRCVNCRMRRRFSSEEKERLRDVPFRVLANIWGCRCGLPTDYAWGALKVADVMGILRQLAGC